MAEQVPSLVIILIMVFSANATKCSDKEFPCGSGLCIQEKYRCNGLRDCYDLADELDCKDKFTCPVNMFQCNNKVNSLTCLIIAPI